MLSGTKGVLLGVCVIGFGPLYNRGTPLQQSILAVEGWVTSGRADRGMPWKLV